MYRARFQIEVRRSQREATADGFGFRRVELPPYRETVELTIDVEHIVRQLGERAVLSKGRRARGMNGAVVVKVVRKRQLVLMMTYISFIHEGRVGKEGQTLGSPEAFSFVFSPTAYCWSRSFGG